MSRPTALARHPTPAEATLRLGGQARHINREHGLTGALLVGADFFVQVLEGEYGSVYETLGRIGADPRHEDMRIFELATTKARMFGSWAMHLGTFERVDPDLIWRCVESFKDPSPKNAQVLIEALTVSVRSAA